MKTKKDMTITVAHLTDPPKDKEFWWSKSPYERLQAVELLRRLNYGERQFTARLQRVLEIARRSSC